MIICALGYGNPTKVARGNQQKRTFTTGSEGTFLLIAVCHLRRVSVVQGTYRLPLSSLYILVTLGGTNEFPEINIVTYKKSYEVGTEALTDAPPACVALN